MPHRPIAPVEATILFYLRDEAADGCGWLRRGVRGWRMYVEVKEATGEYISQRLPYLASRGLLDRIDVAEFGRERPTQLFRISQAGARQVAELEKRPCAPLPAPEWEREDGGNLFVPADAWHSLAMLRRYSVERIGPPRFGSHGWLTALEIHRDAPEPGVELPWLLRRGLVERRRVPAPPGRKSPTAFYRITETALRMEHVDSVAAPSGRVEYVEARIAEDAGPKTARAGTWRPRFGPRPAKGKARKQ